MESYDFSGQKIVIAEDDSSNYLYLKALLKKTKAELIWVQTGRAAVSAVTDTPDVKMVLMDMKMPDMGGIEASAEIKRINPNIVIIAQTAFSLASEREEILSAGCDDFVLKPISGKVLLEKINDYLNGGSSPSN